MSNRRIVLASKSPRRKQMLRQIGLEFEIRESEYEEDMSAMSDPYELAKFLALKKGEDVARHYDDAIIISADTIVVLNNKFFGKPKSEEEAVKMMKDLSGKEHEVVTGFAIIDTINKKVINDFGKCKISFNVLDDKEIEDYVKKTKPFDKAGAYAIQEEAGAFLKSINGDYYSVVGLPLGRVYEELKKMGVEFFKLSPTASPTTKGAHANIIYN